MSGDFLGLPYRNWTVVLLGDGIQVLQITSYPRFYRQCEDAPIQIIVWPFDNDTEAKRFLQLCETYKLQYKATMSVKLIRMMAESTAKSWVENPTLAQLMSLQA